LQEIQHVNCKIFAEKAQIDLADAIPVFHRWIQDQVCPELVVDVADYSHVPNGPGILLIAHEANYSLDQRQGRLGLMYNRKSVMSGTLSDLLRHAYTSAVDACRRLEGEPEFRGKLKFDLRDLEFVINDRMLAPNTDETWNALRNDFGAFFDSIYGTGNFDLQRAADSRERFTVRARPLVASR
jgi:hypothetical protein